MGLHNDNNIMYTKIVYMLSRVSCGSTLVWMGHFPKGRPTRQQEKFEL